MAKKINKILAIFMSFVMFVTSTNVVAFAEDVDKLNQTNEQTRQQDEIDTTNKNNPNEEEKTTDKKEEKSSTTDQQQTKDEENKEDTKEENKQQDTIPIAPTGIKDATPVGTIDDFIKSLSDTSIKEIQLTNSISGFTKNISLNHDITIYGNSRMIDFGKYQLQTNEFSLTLKGALVIESNSDSNVPVILSNSGNLKTGNNSDITIFREYGKSTANLIQGFKNITFGENSFFSAKARTNLVEDYFGENQTAVIHSKETEKFELLRNANVNLISLFKDNNDLNGSTALLLTKIENETLDINIDEGAYLCISTYGTNSKNRSMAPVIIRKQEIGATNANSITTVKGLFKIESKNGNGLYYQYSDCNTGSFDKFIVDGGKVEILSESKEVIKKKLSITNNKPGEYASFDHFGPDDFELSIVNSGEMKIKTNGWRAMSLGSIKTDNLTKKTITVDGSGSYLLLDGGQFAISSEGKTDFTFNVINGGFAQTKNTQDANIYTAGRATYNVRGNESKLEITRTGVPKEGSQQNDKSEYGAIFHNSVSPDPLTINVTEGGNMYVTNDLGTRATISSQAFKLNSNKILVDGENSTLKIINTNTDNAYGNDTDLYPLGAINLGAYGSGDIEVKNGANFYAESYSPNSPTIALGNYRSEDFSGKLVLDNPGEVDIKNNADNHTERAVALRGRNYVPTNTAVDKIIAFESNANKLLVYKIGDFKDDWKTPIAQYLNTNIKAQNKGSVNVSNGTKFTLNNYGRIATEGNLVNGISKTYTSYDDFNNETLSNIIAEKSGSISLDDTMKPFNFIWVANSSKGTVVRFDTDTNEILGEYRTAPEGQKTNPSRTTVDYDGNVWVANRDGNSVTKIGLYENGTWVDRNGNGKVDTSTGLGDIKPWKNTGGVDTNGGASTAEDEAIIQYVRTSSSGTRHVSVDKDNNVWVSGTGNRKFDLIDTNTGKILRTEGPVGYGGYGGLIDGNGVIWSSSPFLWWDTSKPLSGPNGVNWKGHSDGSYGLTIDSKGYVWNSINGSGVVKKYSPDGTLVGTYPQGNSGAQGLVADLNDNIWVTHTLNGSTLGVIKNDGTYLGNLTVPSGPTGVAVDAKGYIWVTCYSGYVAKVDPNKGPIGKDGVTPIGEVVWTSQDLKGQLYNYSDMTGHTLTGKPNKGKWTAVFDSNEKDTEWGNISFNAKLFNSGNIEVYVSTSQDNVTYTAPILVNNGDDFDIEKGQYIKIEAYFTRSKDGFSPILEDLTIGSKLFVNQKPANEMPVLGLTDRLDVETDKEIEIQLMAQDDLITSGNSMKVTWTSTNDTKVIFNDKTVFNPKVKITEDGVYKLTATVTDGVNTVSKDITITATTKPVLKPALSHNLPTEMKVNDRFEATLTVTNMPNFDHYDVKANGTSINVVNDKFTFNPTKPGDYTFVLRAYDDKNSFVEQTHTITVTDVKPPVSKPVELVVNNGNKQSEINKPISVVVTNFDEVNPTDITVKVNTTVITLGNTGGATVTPSKDGDYTFTLTGKDKSGNILNQSITIQVIDTTPKVSNVKLVVNNDKPDSKTNEKIDITISNFNEVNPADITVKVDNTAIAIDNTGKGSYTPTKAGDYTFTLIGKDKQNISLDQSVIIKVIDGTPVPGKEVKLVVNKGNLESKVNQKVEISITNYSEVNPSDIVAKVGTTTIILDGTGKGYVTPTKAGDYVFTLTGKDKYNNPINESVTLKVTEDTPIPGREVKLVVNNGNSEAKVNELIEIAITNYDLVNPNDIQLKIGTQVATLDANGKAYAKAQTTGSFVVVLTGKDKAGNPLNQSVTVNVIEPPKPGGEIKLSINNGLTESEINKPIQINIDGFENINLTDITLKVNDTPITINSTGNATFTPNKIGLYTFTLTGKDKTGNLINLTSKIDVYDPNDQRVPDLELKELGTITEPTRVIGTVTSDGLLKYTLSYAKAESNEYTVFEESSTAVNNSTLGVFDPTKLRNGYYKIKLTGYGSNKRTEEEIIVSVEGNMKIGNFSVDFNDMELPILNFPLTIIRGYDSRDRMESGDFGYGWKLNMDGAKLSESTNLHQGYVQKSMGKLPTMYYIEQTKKHEVSIDWGNGRVDKWALKISPEKQAAPLTYISVKFEPVSKTKDKLEVYELETDLIFNGDMLFNYNGMEFKSQKYKLTKEDGTIIIFNKTTGIEKITTPSGDIITISKTGVTHSDGKSIVFTRDTENRITKITDSNGKMVSYTYDSNGDLDSFTDIGGKITKFKYDKEHYLTEIIDPRGVSAVRNEYNEYGRLVATIDANGNRTEYTHDISKRQEVVKDKLGNVTVFEYDNYGNVVSHTDALGNKITSTYDANHNLKTKTDQLGNTTTFIYGEDGKLISATNAKGNVITNEYNQKGELVTIKNKDQAKLNFTYDDKGNTTKVVDAEGNGKYYDYDQDSNALKSITDDIGTYMKFTYDSNNNVSSTENGNGDIATFTYDSNGNCTSKTIKRNTSKGIEVITENYVLDDYGRVTKVLYKDGTSTSVEYNEIDEISAQVDSKGRRTTYDYDLFGNLVKVVYSDGTFETFEYDAEGRNTKATDRMGRQFILEYDAVGNLISKTYPNGAKESYTYDAKYRLIKLTNINGASTHYEYDSADKNTAITDAFGNKTEFYYNEFSQLISRKDAKGNVYNYEYDKNGNQTKLILPDKTFITSAYDARARVTSQTDQNGYRTIYGYDGLDRLTSVTDADGSKFVYEYNNTNDMISVTDAYGNKTSYEYDIFGRVIKTTNPAGQFTENQYDEAGNLTSTKDYKGTVTTFSYDDLDRITTKTTDGVITKYTYTVDGMLSSASDSTGTTTFKYDHMNNLIEKIEPDGLKITYEYDSSSRLTKITTPYGHTIYVYDIMDRLAKVIDKNGLETVYTYDKNGNRETTTLSNGTKTTYIYDSANRLTEQTTTDKSGKVISKYKYTLGKAGERLKVEETNRTVAYTYDKLYRLTQEKVTEGLVTTTTVYTYDKLSNRTSKTVNGKKTTYTYNILNQLLEETGIKYKYDLNGNLIEKAEQDTKTTYTYDKSNRLIRATIQKGLQVAVEQYKYYSDILGLS